MYESRAIRKGSALEIVPESSDMLLNSAASRKTETDIDIAKFQSRRIISSVLPSE